MLSDIIFRLRSLLRRTRTEAELDDSLVAQGDCGLAATRLERDGYGRLDALGRFGYPRILHHGRTIHPQEPPVMGPSSSFVLHREIEKAIHYRVQDRALRAKPRACGTLRVDPNITSSAGAGIARATVMSVSCIMISPVLWRGTPPASQRTIVRVLRRSSATVASHGRMLCCAPREDTAIVAVPQCH
jgi:hypothetical protein